MPASPARGLGVLDAALIVIGSIVGAGIFLVSSYVAQHARSPAAFLGTWLLGGAVALAGALSNGELGGIFPRSGGEYVYLREAYGPMFGFLSGWMSLWIAFPGSIATLASGLGSAVAPMVGWQGKGCQVAIGAAAIVLLSVINACGLRPGKWTQNILSSAKLAAFAGLLALGIVWGARAPTENGLTPFFGDGGGPAGIAHALIPVLFAYSGWNAATYVTGEIRDPMRSLGRALAIGTAACIALYLLINLVYLRAMPIETLAQTKQPARAAATLLGGRGAAAVLSPLVALCVLSSMQASVLVGPRIYQAMASDGLFFAFAGRLYGRSQVPLLGIAVQCLIALVELISGTFDDLLNLSTFAIVAFSTLTVAAVVVLRVRRPEAPRAFRVPGGPVIPALFVAVNGWLLWSVRAGAASTEGRAGVAGWVEGRGPAGPIRKVGR